VTDNRFARWLLWKTKKQTSFSHVQIDYHNNNNNNDDDIIIIIIIITYCL